RVVPMIPYRPAAPLHPMALAVQLAPCNLPKHHLIGNAKHPCRVLCCRMN
ncbi:hypothetical protein EVAR_74058_1, partial [Eumeta japonica]